MMTRLHLFCFAVVIMSGVIRHVSTAPAESPSSSSPSPSLAPNCPAIVTRAEWGARPPSEPLEPLPHLPVSKIFIHHGATPPDGCHSYPLCVAMVQAYQDYHMNSHGWSDIGYSFIVGEDGRVYEGRGWNHIGAHTRGYNSVGLGFCVIGDFTSRIPDQKALNALRELMQCAVDSGYVTSDYVMMGHRDTNNGTECPGNTFYPYLQTWPHYNNTALN